VRNTAALCSECLRVCLDLCDQRVGEHE
jgi:hypothetical protein